MAKQLNRTPAQVALNRVVAQPGMTSTIIVATTLAQLNDNLDAVQFLIPGIFESSLDEVSALDPVHLYTFSDHTF